MQYSAAEVRQGEEKARRQAIDADQLDHDANGRQGTIDRLAAAVKERSARVEVRGGLMCTSMCRPATCQRFSSIGSEQHLNTSLCLLMAHL